MRQDTAMEAEQALLGMMLLDPRAYDAIANKINETDMFAFAHAEIFKAIVADITGAIKPDYLTVSSRLGAAGLLDKIGGMPYLVGLSNAQVSVRNAAHYAKIVRDAAMRRRALAAAHETVLLIESAPDIVDAVDEAQQKMLALSVRGGIDKTIPWRAVMATTIDQVEARYMSGTSMIGLPTGLHDLDESMCGMQAGDLIILAARPSMGKTTLGMQFVEHSSRVSPAQVFTFEMPKEQLAMRMLASKAGIDFQRLRAGKLGNDDWDRLSHAVGQLGELPIHIEDNRALGLAGIAARCRATKREHGLGLVMIDYLQLMQGVGDNQNERIGSITRGLKILAGELGVPILLLSQLNRGLEQRPNKRPMMSDLRDSGNIEQDADVILFVYRDEVYKPDTEDKGVAEIIIGKQRNGPLQTIRTRFDGAHCRFENMATGAQQVMAAERPKTKMLRGLVRDWWGDRDKDSEAI